METVVIEQNVSKNNEYIDVLGLVMGRFKKQIENDINRINVRQACLIVRDIYFFFVSTTTFQHHT